MKRATERAFDINDPQDRALALKYLKMAEASIAKGWGASAFPAAHIPEPLKGKLKTARGQIAEGLGDLSRVVKQIERMR